MVDVLTLGEAMAALRSPQPVRHGASLGVSIAGAESNVAIGLARLGHKVRWAGVLGQDRFGELVMGTLRAEGVDTDLVRRSSAPTGIVLFEQRLAGVCRVNYHRTASAGSELRPADLDTAFDRAPRILHVTGVTLALGAGPRGAVTRAVRLARERGTIVCLDVNNRRRLWTRDAAQSALNALVSEVDIVIASDDELRLLATGPGGDERLLMESLRARGVKEVVVKHGEKGATLHLPGRQVHQPARPVTAIDTVGAGDAFVAGYLSGMLDGLRREEQLHRAVTLGAFAVATEGDWEGLPHREELALLDATPGEPLR
jgi:2-dehydro-3-deoxygluconokinase